MAKVEKKKSGKADMGLTCKDKSGKVQQVEMWRKRLGRNADAVDLFNE